MHEERVIGLSEFEGAMPSRVAIVVAGAGARGAYEAGVLSVVVPHLKKTGVDIDLFVGTSAGAIISTLFAANAHLPALDQAECVLDTWRQIRTSDVFRSPALTTPVTAARWAGQLLGIPGVQLTSLVDTAPLRRTADRAVDWKQLRSNVDEGRVSLAVVATAVTNNRTTVFVDRRSQDPLPPLDHSRSIEYVDTSIAVDHVMASAAIPVLFPAVHVGHPAASRGWYDDGGVRLNTPLKPAVDLGADAVIVIATHPAIHSHGEELHTDISQPPDAEDAAVRVMDAALVDRMVEDVHTLGEINELVSTGGRRQHADGREDVVIPYLVFGPAERGTLGTVAARCFEQRTEGPLGALRAIGRPDMHLLGRLLGGRGRRRGDLLSYLLFDRGFMEASIELGKQDAAEALASTGTGPVPWRTHAL